MRWCAATAGGSRILRCRAEPDRGMGPAPQAAALVAALSDPDRGWDAIVVGEYERAFYGSQYALVAPLLHCITASGCGCRRREAGSTTAPSTMSGYDGPRAVVETGGHQDQHPGPHRDGSADPAGRYLGGCPPYGYRLGDAGPHPNKAHAAWGRRAHRLEPDPQTGHVVRWIFAQRLAGHSVRGRALCDQPR